MEMTIIRFLTSCSVKSAGQRSNIVLIGGSVSTISFLRKGNVWSIFWATRVLFGVFFCISSTSSFQDLFCPFPKGNLGGNFFHLFMVFYVLFWRQSFRRVLAPSSPINCDIRHPALQSFDR